MFFTFPIVATDENWLSDWLNTYLLCCLRALETDAALPEYLVDLDGEYRAEVERFTGIWQRVYGLVEVARELSTEERDLLVSSVVTQNNIPAIFDGATECSTCTNALPDAHQRARELFQFCFERLSKIRTPGSAGSIRDRQYQTIFENTPSCCCAFCGMSRLEPYHPNIPRHDMDHFLAISRYPFAGTNLRNLVPMCDRCNSAYKGAEDILYDHAGNRLACVFPYGEEIVELEVSNSDVFGEDGGGPVWDLRLVPDSAKARNWDRIFRIRFRYVEGVLKTEYNGWLIQMGGFLSALGYNIGDKDAVIEGLRKYCGVCEYESLPGIARIKLAVVTFLVEKLEEGPESNRLERFLLDAWSE